MLLLSSRIWPKYLPSMSRKEHLEIVTICCFIMSMAFRDKHRFFELEMENPMVNSRVLYCHIVDSLVGNFMFFFFVCAF